MSKFWRDRIAIGVSLVGIVLMVLTIVWHVNPVEGSVVPRFLTQTQMGTVILWLLLVTCMPVWIVTVGLSVCLPVRDDTQWLLACVSMVIVQAIVYFLLGKLISVCVRKIRGKQTANMQAEARRK